MSDSTEVAITLDEELSTPLGDVAQVMAQMMAQVPDVEAQAVGTTVTVSCDGVTVRMAVLSVTADVADVLSA